MKSRGVAQDDAGTYQAFGDFVSGDGWNLGVSAGFQSPFRNDSVGSKDFAEPASIRRLLQRGGTTGIYHEISNGADAVRGPSWHHVCTNNFCLSPK